MVVLVVVYIVGEVVVTVVVVGPRVGEGRGLFGDSHFRILLKNM